MRFINLVRLTLLTIAVIAVLLVGVVKSVDIEHYRPLLSEIGQNLMGRPVVVHGRLSLRLSVHPALVAEDVTLANVAGGTQADMIRIKRVEAEISLFGLLWRDVRIQAVSLIEPTILLERDGLGRGNWQIGREALLRVPETTAGLPTHLEIHDLRIIDGTVLWTSGERTGRLTLERLLVQADRASMPMIVTLKGQWGRWPLDLSAVLDSFAHWQDETAGRSHPIQVKLVLPSLVAAAEGGVRVTEAGLEMDAVRISADTADVAAASQIFDVPLPALGAGRLNVKVGGAWDALSLSDVELVVGRKDAAALSVRGAVANVMARQGVDLRLSLSGETVAGFNKPLGVTGLPALPLTLSGRVADLPAGAWRFYDLKAGLGRNDLSGEILWRPGTKRGQIEAHLISTRLDLSGLDGLSLPVAVDGRIFSPEPWDLSLLHKLDGDLLWRIDHLALPREFELDHLTLHAKLADGRLSLRQRGAPSHGGLLGMAMTLDAGRTPAALVVDAALDRVQIGDVLRSVFARAMVEGGRGDWRLSLSGRGRSWQEMLGQMSGESLLLLDEMRPSPSVIDWFNSGAGVVLQPWPDRSTARLGCLVNRLVLTGGLARSEVLSFEAGAWRFTGRGSLNLGNERLDVTLMPQPKDPVSVLGGGRASNALPVVVPLDIGGMVSQPALGPNRAVLGKTGGGGAMGAVLPGLGDGQNRCLAALLPVSAASLGAKSGKGGKLAPSSKAIPTISKPAPDPWRDLFRDGP